jgi:D-sedoheptulose 7-phosphate isomerase
MEMNGRNSQVKRIAGDYLESFATLLREIDLAAVERIVEHFQNARRQGATIFIAGNGGSAATASHWVNDLNKATKKADETPVRAMSLSDNVSWLTALANDEGYEKIFTGQLENFARPHDLLVVISASGNSPNLVEAVNFARTRNLLTIGFLGFDGGTLKQRLDDYVWLPTEKGAYGLVESGHSLLCHLLTICVSQASRKASFKDNGE